MHLDHGFACVILLQSGGQLLSAVAHKVQTQGNGNFHAAVVVIHNGTEHRRLRKAADLLHFRQVLVIQR